MNSYTALYFTLQDKNVAERALMSDEEQTSFVPLGDVLCDILIFLLHLLYLLTSLEYVVCLLCCK